MLFAEVTEVLDPEPHGAALNMAIDEALLRTAEGPLLRIYRWERPAISFGYFEKYAQLEPAPAGWERVRRWTGGGVVPHGEDLTYTLVVPASEPLARWPARQSYRQIHACLAGELRRQGLATRLADATAPKISSACFANAAVADLLDEGSRKIAGAAQRRTRAGLLHQGSIQGLVRSEGLASSFAAHVTRRALTAAELELAHELARTRYGTEDWLRRF